MPSVSTTEVADDWSERWKAFHSPVDIGPLRVRPPWEPPRDGALDVVIDFLIRLKRYPRERELRRLVGTR